MPLYYDFFETPQPKSRKTHVRYHARVLQSQTVKTDDLAGFINECCSVTKADVKAVLEALVQVAEFEMGRGNRIHLEGFGYFQISLTCPPIKSPKEIRAESVSFKTVTFRPEISLKKRFQHLNLVKTREKRHSNKYSDIEIDGLLTSHFLDHSHITCEQLQKLCGFTRSTAYRRLQKLIEDGKLERSGHPNVAIYVPLPGNYRR